MGFAVTGMICEDHMKKKGDEFSPLFVFMMVIMI